MLCQGQDVTYSLRYFDDNSGLSHGRISKIMEDANGMIWFATWNGLSRFDGEQFVSFKSQPGDGVRFPGYRFRDIYWADDGRLYCQIEDRVLAFDTQLCRFDTLPEAEEQHSLRLIKERREEVARRMSGKTTDRSVNGQVLPNIQRDFHDSKGNRWLVDPHGFYIASPIRQRGEMRTQTEARAVCQMRNGDIWVAERASKQLVIYSANWERKQTLLSAPIYSILETSNGDVLLGEKPGCVIRLHEGKRSLIEGVENVYDIIEDKQGRYWMASFSDGIVCVDDSVIRHLSEPLQARRLCLTDRGVLLAATVSGLWMMSDIYSPAPSTSLLTRDPNRVTSLASNAVMDITQIGERVFLGLGTSGVDQLSMNDLTSPLPEFLHLTSRDGLSSDIVYQTLPWLEDQLLIQRPNGLSLLSVSDGQVLNFDRSFFGRDMHLEEVRPVLLQDSTLLISTSSGLMTISPDAFQPSTQKVHIAICSITRSNEQPDYAVDACDTIRLSKSQRSIAIRFSALDYSNTATILYRTQLQPQGGKSAEWTVPGQNHEVMIQDLAPGEYCFSIEASTAEGHWTGNFRRLTILVEPTFTESKPGRILIMSALLFFLTLIIYFIVLTRTLRAKRQATLNAYLELQERLQQLQPQQEPAVLTPGLNSRDEQFINQLRQFVQQNMSNSDVLVDDMARFVGMSRSSLTQKIKQLFNLSPADFLREARIRHACELLRTTDMQMKEVAYACGFTDPKYFTRCFKASTGKTPTQFKG